MSKPFVTQILDIIDERLRNIRKSGGYFFDVRKVERSRLTPFITDDLPSVTYHPTRLAVTRTRYGTETKELSLYIEFYSMTYDRPFVDVASELASDIVSAVNRDSDGAESLNLGGAVSVCSLTDCTYQVGEGQSPYCGVWLVFRISYETKINEM